MPWGTRNIPPQKNLSRGSLSNWCDADEDEDADTDIYKTRDPLVDGNRRLQAACSIY